MALLDNAVADLAAHAGWKTPRPDEDGAYRFRLENGLDFCLFTPDDRICVMRAGVAEVPAAGPDREELLRATAMRQAGVCRSRASIAALEGPGQSLLKSASSSGERIILYRTVELAIAREMFVSKVKDFLNDLAWWKAASGGGRTERGGERPLFGMPGMFPGSIY